MMSPWFQRDPTRYAQEQHVLHATYPSLRMEVVRDIAVVSGLFVLGDAAHTETVEFPIRILLPDDYPRGLPRLFPENGCIPCLADRHMKLNGEACLGITGDIRKHWLPGSLLVDFIQRFFPPFFASQVYYDETGEWPFPARSHSAMGIVEWYEEELRVAGVQVVLTFLDILRSSFPQGHRSCPCGSGQRVRRCHGPMLERLRDWVRPDEAAMEYQMVFMATIPDYIQRAVASLRRLPPY